MTRIDFSDTWMRPNLWRVVTFALTLALIANFVLARLVKGDTFALIVSYASLFAAVAMQVCYWFARRLLDIAYLIAFGVWMANLIEYATDDFARWESQARQGGFYAGFGLLALGAFIASRVANDRRNETNGH